MRRRTTWTVAAAVLAVGVGTAAPAAATPGTASTPARPSGTAELTMLATTDVHGRAQDWDYFKNAPATGSGVGGLARVGSVVESVRAAKGADSVVVVDNGDFLQGTPLSYYYASQEPVTETGLEHPMAAAFDAIGYDAQVVGNHEYNYGLDLLRKYTEDAGHPVLGANVVTAGTDQPYHQPFTLERRQLPGQKPITVGILGLTTPGSAIWDRGNVEGRVEFRDMVATAQKWVPVVDALADVVVVLSHAGVGGTSSYTDAGVPTENPTDTIARTVPGIDVMVVGHSHLDKPSQTVVNEQTGRKVLLTQPYRYGSSVSQVDIDLEKVRGQWTVAGTSATALYTRDYPEDPEVLAAVADEHATTVEYVNQVVATSTEELTTVSSWYEDTPILDFIQNVQIETVEAALEGTDRAGLPVLSVAAPFSRTSVFPKGDVSIRDIAGLYVYDNTLEAVEMTGAQVRAYLEETARYFGQVTTPGQVGSGALVTTKPDYNYDTLSGVDYELDISRPAFQRVTRLEIGGVPVADTDRFVVAVNNYRRSGGGGFPHIAQAPVVYNEQQEIRQLLIEWAQEHKVIDPADFYVPNWQLVANGRPVVD
jgi:2',3'-cyclic-nucleotide 2'-phosphodiesterase/3'-nucleotidase